MSMGMHCFVVILGGNSFHCRVSEKIEIRSISDDVKNMKLTFLDHPI